MHKTKRNSEQWKNEVLGVVVESLTWRLQRQCMWRESYVLRPPLFGLQIPENHFAMDSWESAVALDSWESESDCLFTLLFVSFRSCGCCEMSVTPSTADYDVYMQIKEEDIEHPFWLQRARAPARGKWFLKCQKKILTIFLCMIVTSKCCLQIFTQRLNILACAK